MVNVLIEYEYKIQVLARIIIESAKKQNDRMHDINAHRIATDYALLSQWTKIKFNVVIVLAPSHTIENQVELSSGSSQNWRKICLWYYVKLNRNAGI